MRVHCHGNPRRRSALLFFALTVKLLLGGIVVRLLQFVWRCLSPFLPHHALFALAQADSFCWLLSGCQGLEDSVFAVNPAVENEGPFPDDDDPPISLCIRREGEAHPTLRELDGHIIRPSQIPLPDHKKNGWQLLCTELASVGVVARFMRLFGLDERQQSFTRGEWRTPHQ